MDLHSATKTPYRPDVLPAGKSIAAMFASGLGGGFVAFVGWWLLKQVELPAFNTSMVTRAVATAGTVLLAVVAIALCTWWLWPSRSRRCRRLFRTPCCIWFRRRWW
ncbi:arabinofuranosyltransferase [Corynebacterium renale]|uniref:arabinofuranosyltransferase n=1 Tax=Corynebacterium renale TaxID=1724 RepID=UPI001EEDA490|nr:arabinofuranosyltransferase [Corynebacterium renale]